MYYYLTAPSIRSTITIFISTTTTDTINITINLAFNYYLTWSASTPVAVTPNSIAIRQQLLCVIL